MRTMKALVFALPAMLTMGEAASVMTVSTITVGTLLSAPAYAAKDSVSAKVGKPLQEAQALVKSNDFKGALAKVKEAQAISDKTPFEEKTINEFLAFVALKQGDYTTAAKAYEDLLNAPGSDAQQLPQRLLTLTQLNYQNKNYPKAIQFGSRYLKDVGNNVDVALLVTQAYYIQKDYPHTLEAVNNLFKVAAAAGQPVKENWLQLQMSSLHLLNRDDEAVAVLEKLLVSFPSKAYWKDMLTIVKNAGGLTDRGHVELYRLKRAADVLEPSEMVEMAELAMAVGVPGDAKSILESGFASKDLGAGASKDRENRLLNKARTDSDADLKVLDSQAKQAASAATGDLGTKIGEAYSSYGQYDKAIESISNGLKKGGVTAEDEANLHLGQALFATKKYSEAANAFKAVKSDSKYARIAHLWMILANNKK